MSRFCTLQLAVFSLGLVFAAAPARAGSDQTTDPETPPSPPARWVDDEPEPMGMTGDDELLAVRFIGGVDATWKRIPALHYEHDLGDTAAVTLGGTTILLVSGAYAGIHVGRQSGLLRPYVLTRAYGLFGTGLSDDFSVEGAASAGLGLEIAWHSGLSVQLEIEGLALFESDASPPLVVPVSSVGIGRAW